MGYSKALERQSVLTRAPRVYLAGKIGKTDWRHGLFDLRHVELDYHHGNRRAELAQVAPTADGFDCCGPFFLGDDHGCFHGPHRHGLLESWYADGVGMRDHGFPQGLPRDAVVRSCLDWLRQADVVFAWIDAAGPYGTMVELGYAAALGLPIYLAFDEKIAGDVGGESFWMDLWFSRELATDGMRPRSTAGEAWTSFVGWWRTRMTSYWLRRQADIEHGRIECPMHRPSKNNWR